MEKIKLRADGLPDLGSEYWDLKCAHCGGRWGYDHMSGPGTCIDKDSGQAKSTKFKLADGYQPFGSKKIVLTRECPCGIYRGDCEYHK